MADNFKNHYKFYSGRAGLAQISRNSLNSQGELLIYETSYASLNTIFDPHEADKLRREFLDHKVRVRELTNRAYHEPYTNVSGFHEEVMEIRYIDPKKLEIRTEMLIYNDTVAVYSTSGELYGLEIKNEQLAKMQKQIFEFVWKTGERPIIGSSRSSLF